VPRLGIRRAPGGGDDQVLDWAYEYERMFAVMSPEESLDNADTYAVLVRRLAEPAAPGHPNFHPDHISGTADPVPVERGLALVEQRARETSAFLHQLSSAWGTPAAQSNLAILQQYFPSAVAQADVDALAVATDALATVMHNAWTARVVASGPGGALAWTSSARVSAGAWAATGIPGADLTVTRSWLALDERTRVRLLYTLLMADRAAILGSFAPIAAGGPDTLARLAERVVDDTLPEPGSNYASDHLREDFRQRLYGIDPP
jgi:hypothetical protein